MPGFSKKVEITLFLHRHRVPIRLNFPTTQRGIPKEKNAWVSALKVPSGVITVTSLYTFSDTPQSALFVPLRPHKHGRRF